MRIGSELVLFDLGTGIRGFGETAKAPVRGNIFISHYHYDHLQGLPFFTPIFDPRNEFIVRGPTREGRTVQDVVSGQMQQPFFPVTAEMVFRAKLTYQPVGEGDRVEIGDGVVTALETNHPGGNLAYRIDCQGKSIVYATDTEHGTPRDAKLIEFARNADFFIYDAMYTEDEYRGKIGSPKLGWGHSTWQTAVDVANAAQVGTLVLFHHDPTRTDEALDALVAQVQAVRKQTIAAREGLVLIP